MAIEDLGRSISDGRKAVGEIREVVAAIAGVVKSHLVTQLSDAVNELELYLLPDAESAHAYIQELGDSNAE